MPRGDVDRLAVLAGELAGLLPAGSLFQGFTTRGVQAAIDELGRLHSPAIDAAEQACGLSREDIAQRLEDEPQLVPLAARVLFQAGMTNQDETLRALGAMLGALILTPDDTDEAELIIIGLGDLRRVHLQILRVMDGSPKSRITRRQERARPELTRLSDALAGRIGDTNTHDSSGDELITIETDAWNVEALADESGLSRDRTMLAVAGLVKSGFASTPTVVDGPGYVIAPAGKVVLEVLRRYQTQAPVDRRQDHGG